MSDKSSISCFRPSWFKLFSSSPSKNFRPPQTPERCDVSILGSRSLSVTSLVADLSSHFKKLGVSIAFSGDPTIFRTSVCIVVLSKDYADSRDRLEELRRIQECKVDLIPIFFDVRPSEVRKVDEGVFEEAFVTNKGESRETWVDGWRVAFERMALISGWKFTDFENSRKLLKAVVQNVMKKVNSASLQVAKYPVGLAEKTQKLEMLLESEQTVLGIVGMGGIGKTTLAKEFFNTNKTRFKATCFFEDVKGTVEKIGLERVQSLLLKELLYIDHHIHSTNQGKYLIKKCLLGSEVLIVLDNIDNFDHLDALCATECIHEKSIILITTRDRRLVECIQKSLVYDMEGLENKYARELFCWHAFLMPYPALGYGPLVEEFVRYCGGLPLSLETLGGKLFGEELQAWKGTLNNISDSLPGNIEKQIRVSYDALDWLDKQMFLDIALFFIGEDKEMAVRIWNASEWVGSVGVQSLQQKCLVKVENGKFQIHDQLRQMAEKIVDEEDAKNPGCRSRLWRPNDVTKVLRLECGSKRVEGIKLTAKQIEDDRLHSFRSFAPMTELRLLILEGRVEGDFSLLSKNVLWLCWRSCPMGSLPAEFPLQNLRVLDLSGGNINSPWSDDPQQIPVHLEELSLQGCKSLQKFPKSIKFLKVLEKLVLSRCLKLVYIPDGFCDIYSLKHVDLSGCSGLHFLPGRIGNWMRLQYFDLSDCINLRYLPPSFGELEKLEHLDLSGCSALSKLPPSFHKLEEIRYLNLGKCFKLEAENDITAGLHKLEFLNMQSCKRLNAPDAVTCQHSIRILKISCSQFSVLPRYLGDLESLEELSLWDGYEVKTLDPLVFTKLSILKDLTIGQFPLLKSIGSSLGHLMQLKTLVIRLCGIVQLPKEVGYLKGLQHLVIDDCPNLAKLPTTLKRLSCLTILNLTGCSSLQLDRSAFPNISTLEKLVLGNCKVTNQFFLFLYEGGITLKELEFRNMSLPTLGGIGSGPSNVASCSIISCSNISSFEIPTGISSLKIEDCPDLKKVTVPVHNTSLQNLHLSNCKNIVEFCSIENLKYLKGLNFNSCFNLRTVAGLEKLNKLSELHLFLSSWYLSHEDHDNYWLKKTLETAKMPRATHLSARINVDKCQFNFPSCFQKITKHSPNKFMFKLNCNTRKSFCGVVLFFIAHYYPIEDIVSGGLTDRKEICYDSVYFWIDNGAISSRICKYDVLDPSIFFHVSVFMDEFLLSQMFAAGSELVISSEKDNMVYEAWFYLVPSDQKHLAGEVTHKVIDKLKENYVGRSDLDLMTMHPAREVSPNLIDNLTTHESAVVNHNLNMLHIKYHKLLYAMNFRRIFALGLRSFAIHRTFTLYGVPVYAETFGGSRWIKHKQMLFEAVNRFEYLDLELGRRCRNLVEDPLVNGVTAEIYTFAGEDLIRSYKLNISFRPRGSSNNFDFLDKIISSHEEGFDRVSRHGSTLLEQEAYQTQSSKHASEILERVKFCYLLFAGNIESLGTKLEWEG